MSDGGDETKYNKRRGARGAVAVVHAWVASRVSAATSPTGGSGTTKGSSGSWQHQQQAGVTPWQAAGLLLAVVCVLFSGSMLRHRLLVRKALSSPIAEPPGGLALDLQQHAADEMLLRQLVDECSKRQDTVLQLDAARRLVVVNDTIDLGHCPILDLMLRGAERGVGTCTDVALYVLHAGGRIIPMPRDVAAYDRSCGPRTARLFLESMYSEFVSRQRGVLHLQLLNSEHVWTADQAVHARMQGFLCKTRFCVELTQRHVVAKRYWASVWYMQHTSSDPSVGLSGDVAAGLRASLALGKPMEQGFAIHVKGKSGLKQTRAVLDCWARHPEFPTLVVVGRVSDEELSPDARSAPNIALLPPLADQQQQQPAGSPQQQQQQQQLIDAGHVRDLQGAASLHLCPSVREGFGHYLNEARAAGALVVTTDHPPMNELITPASGLLVPTSFTKSEPGTELGRLAHLNGHVTADGLCATVAAGLALPADQADAKRAAARAAFRADKAAFLHRMAQLRALLQARADAAVLRQRHR